MSKGKKFDTDVVEMFLLDCESTAVEAMLAVEQ